jgi:protocatechuate 3,4-dioxygenase alpha subunit
MSTLTTPSQTVGPFFHIGLTPLDTTELANSGVPGERVIVRGRVLDGDSVPVSDALIEVWQASADGKHARADRVGGQLARASFRGFGRTPTDEAGSFRFATIKPGRVVGPDGALQAPHLVIAVFMRGLLKHLVTRVYFPDEPANADDPVLKLVPAERRATLIAKKIGAALEWNIVLQGKDETVFFDY